jgi:hypothetical protein
VTEAEALGRLALFTSATAEPVLSPADLEVLLAMARRVDKNTVLPGDADWEPTYDLNYAAAQGWLIKAGRLSPRYNFMSGGKMLSRQQYYDHCMKNYYRYAMKSPTKAHRLGMSPLGLSNVPTNSW